MSWEAGSSVPTYVQLEKLAYTTYKLPIAVFFFPSPPDEEEAEQSFRTLPADEIEHLHPDTRFHVRRAQAMQVALEELHDGTNPSKRKIFRDVPASLNVSALAGEVRRYLGITLEEQRTWKNLDEALKNWRDVIQDNGIYVFKESLKQREISGFCLWHDEFPVIYINNSTSPSRQIFTLFHELAHLLFHVSGVTKEDDGYVARLPKDYRDIEVVCNKFAAEFLVPDDVFDELIQNMRIDSLAVQELAGSFKVSREVVLRKLLDRKLVSRNQYQEWVEEWNDQYLKSKNKNSGGSYYDTKASYLGRKYMELAFSRYYQGRLSLPELAQYLDVKASNVAPLESLLAK